LPASVIGRESQLARAAVTTVRFSLQVSPAIRNYKTISSSKAWSVLVSEWNSQMPSKGLESLSSTRAAAAQPCFIERGSNSKMISEEDHTLLESVEQGEDSAKHSMKMRWKRNF